MKKIWNEHFQLYRILVRSILRLINWIVWLHVFMYLSPFKIFYYLINDWKQKHQLNDKNCKKLAILSRIIQTIMIYFGIIIVRLIYPWFFLASLSSNLSFWIIFFILMTPVIIMTGTTTIATICLYIIVFNYYTMIFDQINKQFDLICNKMSKLFNKRQEDKEQSIK